MKKILIITPYYLPSFMAGGPVRSISNLVNKFKKEYSFSIVTPNNDLDGSKYPNTTPDQWNIVNDTDVLYVENYIKLIDEMKKYSEFTDVLYINSMFSLKYSILIVLLNYLKIINFKKVIIAPRGEFASSALDIKPLKKNIFLRVSKIFGFHNNIIWHATAKKEYDEIKKLYNNSEVIIANNISSDKVIDDFKLTKIKKIKNELHIVYIARIVPIKNLLFSLEVLDKISTDITIYFDIYGPMEDEDYWNKCQKIINNLSQNIIVNYKGSLDNEKVLDTIKKYHLYFLPTKGENFGHSIAEALKSSCPVLISDQTPWMNLEDENIGWDISLLDKNKYIDIIQQLATLTHEDILDMSIKVNKYIKNYLLDKEIDKQYNKLFK